MNNPLLNLNGDLTLDPFGAGEITIKIKTNPTFPHEL